MNQQLTLTVYGAEAATALIEGKEFSDNPFVRGDGELRCRHDSIQLDNVDGGLRVGYMWRGNPVAWTVITGAHLDGQYVVTMNGIEGSQGVVLE